MEHSTEVSEISDGLRTPEDTESITSDIFGVPDIAREGEESFSEWRKIVFLTEEISKADQKNHLRNDLLDTLLPGQSLVAVFPESCLTLNITLEKPHHLPSIQILETPTLQVPSPDDWPDTPEKAALYMSQSFLIMNMGVLLQAISRHL